MKNIDENIKNIKEKLEKYTVEDKLDIVLLPEMAFTGYNFENREDIKPYTEQ